VIWAIIMPSWGLSMEEGTLVDWQVNEGARVAIGDELVEIETSKISNRLEAPHEGVLRRQVAKSRQTIPCGDLIGIIATEEVSETAIDAFIAQFPRPLRTVSSAGEKAVSDSISKVELPSGDWLQCESLGKHGSAVVLIHGFGGDSKTWLFNQARLAERHRTHAFDLPGHGGSSRCVKHGSIQELAHSVAYALDNLKLDRIHLVGHSMGAAIALALCERQPETIASVSLVAPFAFGGRANQRYLSDFISAQRSRDVQRCLAMLFTDPKAVRRDMVEEVLRHKRLDGVTETLEKIATCVLREPAPDPDLKIPTNRMLVLRGMHDNIISDVTVPAGVRLETLTRSGHMPQMEEPDSVNVLLLEHFANADGAGAQVP
jgi:pyruvate dehydrogenase E2 component (dihydrolipoamide acetyltransferase)